MKKIGLIAGAFIASALMSISASAEKLPEKYDLREVENALPEVFAQGGLGTCWSVASNSAFEIALRMNNMKDENGEYYKLSMYHNDWCTASYYIDGTYTGYKTGMYVGGFSDLAYGYWLSGKGPIKEELVPYDESITSIYKKETLQPTIGKMVTGIDVVVPEASMGEMNCQGLLDSDEIKSKIMKYGAGIASVRYTSEYENTEYNSLFFPRYAQTDHEILVVGWDDNFPADHFNNTASQNGAWIIRNSWGNYNSDDGYFYVSYDDIPFRTNPVTFITGLADNNYDNVYSPTELTGNGFDGYNSDIDTDGIEYSAVVFDKTANTQNIHEVMLPLLNGTEYSVYLVDDYKDASSLTDRKLLVSGIADYRGYHLVQFDPVDIKGDKFAIVISYSSKTDDKLISAVGAYSSAIYSVNFKKGVCYMSNNGKKWKDLADKNEALDIYVYGNNTCKTTNVTFETDPWYALVNVYKNGVPQLMNPDGSYDLKKGNYTYTLLIDGEETKKYKFTVDGKSDTMKVSKTLNVKPFAYDGDIEIGADDPASTGYVLYYNLGSGKYAADGIKKITVNGKSIYFYGETGSALYYTLPSSIKKSAGDKLEFVIVYKNGVKEKFAVETKAGCSELGAVEKTFYNAKEICESFEACKENMADALAEKLEALSEKYNKNVYVYADLYNDGPFILGDYNIGCSFGDFSNKVTIKADTSPTFNNLKGWDKITEYAKSHDNCEMKISVFNNSTVPSDFMAAVKGKNITVHLDATETRSYVFNGKDVDSTDSFVMNSAFFLTTDAYFNGMIHSDDGLIGSADFTTYYISSPYGITVKGYVEYRNIIKDRIMVVYRQDDGVFIKDYAFKSDGNFRIDVDAGETAALLYVGLAGDLNSNGGVENGDLNVLQKYFDGKITLSIKQFLRADVNCDGVVDKNDYKLIKKLIKTSTEKDENAA